VKLDFAEAGAGDQDAVWAILEPTFRAGDTYAIDSGITRKAALAYWFAERAYVVRLGGETVGTFYIQENRPGGGTHYCNCGFVTSAASRGRGIARAMLDEALVRAARLGFEGMVFNFVVASNTRAIAIWEGAGFEVVGRVPGAFRHTGREDVDALVMFRRLDQVP